MNPEQLAKSGTESAHQKAFFAWLNMAAQYGPKTASDMNAYVTRVTAEQIARECGDKSMPVLEYAFAIPNGGLRGKATAANLKGEGVKAGVPDIFIPLPRLQFSGLFIEMKKEKGGVVSNEQAEWHLMLRAFNYSVHVCRGWTEAVEAVLQYMQDG